MRSERIRLFQTLPHPCGYFAGRTAQNLVIDPAAPQLDQLYPQTLPHGFRRAGGHLYHPRCPGCRACVPCRVPVAGFVPDRSQRRCLQRNADLAISEVAAGFTTERHALYTRYLNARHPGGGMDDAEPEDFERFLSAPWSPTRFVEMRLRGQLLAVAVTDVCANALSAVYTFFDPDARTRGLGTFAVLTQIELARRRALAHVYLGFWIAGHPKMDYKRRFRPLEVRSDNGWHVLEQRAGAD
ncbi:MAG TPA: arginyltransferase [Rhodanobacteraceae bacterium]|nr:arginyltransferase [Rhodanobacteraceae bacterium]